MLDRRVLPHHPVNVNARLILVDGSGVIDCTLRNITAGGAH